MHYHGIESETLNPVPEVLTSEWGAVFKDFIVSNRDKCIVIDLRGIKVSEKVFHEWKMLSDICLIYINCSEIVAESISKTYYKFFA